MVNLPGIEFDLQCYSWSYDGLQPHPGNEVGWILLGLELEGLIPKQDGEITCLAALPRDGEGDIGGERKARTPSSPAALRRLTWKRVYAL